MVSTSNLGSWNGHWFYLNQTHIDCKTCWPWGTPCIVNEKLWTIYGFPMKWSINCIKLWVFSIYVLLLKVFACCHGCQVGSSRHPPLVEAHHQRRLCGTVKKGAVPCHGPSDVVVSFPHKHHGFWESAWIYDIPLNGCGIPNDVSMGDM